MVKLFNLAKYVNFLTIAGDYKVLGFRPNGTISARNEGIGEACEAPWDGFGFSPGGVGRGI